MEWEVNAIWMGYKQGQYSLLLICVYSTGFPADVRFQELELRLNDERAEEGSWDNIESLLNQRDAGIPEPGLELSPTYG